MATQPTQPTQPPAFPLSAVECQTLADALASASTALHQFAEKRAHGQGLEDPEAAALWRRVALTMLTAEVQGKDFNRRLEQYARAVRRWGGLDN